MRTEQTGFGIFGIVLVALWAICLDNFTSGIVEITPAGTVEPMVTPIPLPASNEQSAFQGSISSQRPNPTPAPMLAPVISRPSPTVPNVFPQTVSQARQQILNIAQWMRHNRLWVRSRFLQNGEYVYRSPEQIEALAGTYGTEAELKPNLHNL